MRIFWSEFVGLDVFVDGNLVMLIEGEGEGEGDVLLDGVKIVEDFKFYLI